LKKYNPLCLKKERKGKINHGNQGNERAKKTKEEWIVRITLELHHYHVLPHNEFLAKMIQ